jgi:hypothetical protein
MAEWHAIGFRQQAIDEVFFGSERSGAMQFEMTWGVAHARRAEQDRFNAHIESHRDAIAALRRGNERGLGTRARRLTGRIRNAISSAFVQGDDIAF